MTASTDVAPLLEASTEIEAPPSTVWALVSDLRNMGRWSPQCKKTFVLGGETKLGATAVNINRRGLLFWPTRSKVVAFEPETKIAFRILDNFTVWSYSLESRGNGTVLTVRREAPRGTSKVSAVAVDKVLGGQQTFTSELEAGMVETLGRIKAEAEAG